MLAQGMAGPDLKTFEFMSRFGVEIVVKHTAGAREPLEGAHDWYVLLELASQSESGLNDTMMGLLEAAFEKEIVEDAAVATSLDQRKAFWVLRENLSEMQKFEGGSIKHDVCVARGAGSGLSGRGARRWSRRRFPARGPCPSAIWATAIFISTSASRSAPTSRPISRAGKS